MKIKDLMNMVENYNKVAEMFGDRKVYLYVDVLQRCFTYNELVERAKEEFIDYKAFLNGKITPRNVFEKNYFYLTYVFDDDTITHEVSMYRG